MGKHWYRIDILEGDKGRVLVGASEYAPPQLIKQLRSDEYLLLTDLSYRDNQNRIVSWSTWDPRLASVAYINPKYITSVMPFAGDPRSSGPEAQ
jgi:hypothetical protein